MSRAPRLYVGHGRLVSAVRYDGTDGHRDAVLSWATGLGWPARIRRGQGYEGFYAGDRYVRPGDWVVRRYDGEMTSCSDRDFWAFHATYPGPGPWALRYQACERHLCSC